MVKNQLKLSRQLYCHNKNMETIALVGWESYQIRVLEYLFFPCLSWFKDDVKKKFMISLKLHFWYTSFLPYQSIATQICLED